MPPAAYVQAKDMDAAEAILTSISVIQRRACH